MQPDPRPDPGVADVETERRRDEFDAMVDAAARSIPPPFADHLESVAIVTEDEARPDQQRPGVLLLGLYEGVPRTAWGASGVPVPCRITLYRLPHELLHPDPADRARAVESTLRHEVAHHFGTDEARIRRIEAQRLP
jgi:predicted Zn-dependent protease with MMP-like domain